MSSILLASGFAYNSSQASTSSPPPSIENNNCVNDTNMTSNYLTMECSNTLTNTTNAVSDLDCVTSAGWFNVCAWLEQDVDL